MKKVLLFVLLIMIVVAVLMYKYFGNIAGFQANLESDAGVQEFNSFLKAHEAEHVVLSLQLSDAMRLQVAKGLKERPEVLFTASNPNHPNETINYILKQLEGGKRLFIFNEESGKLEGLFKTTTKVTSQGKSFTYLIPTNPSSLERQ